MIFSCMIRGPNVGCCWFNDMQMKYKWMVEEKFRGLMESENDFSEGG
jgi:hypothetical protein